MQPLPIAIGVLLSIAVLPFPSPGSASAFGQGNGSDGELNVVILWDVSRSSPVAQPEAFRTIASDLSRSITPKDRIRVGVFARDIAIASVPLADARTLAARLAELAPTVGVEPSRVWDAVDEAIAVLSAETGNRVIFLVTDGRAIGNANGLEDVARRAVTNNIAVFTLGEAAGDGSAKALEWLSRMTGGTHALDGPAQPKVDPRMNPNAFLRSRQERLPGPGKWLAEMIAAARTRTRIHF